MKLPLRVRMVGGAHKQTHLIDADRLQVATIHPAANVHALREMRREQIEELKTAHANALVYAVNFVQRLTGDQSVPSAIRDEATEIVRQLSL